jgi:hypothetical protein
MADISPEQFSAYCRQMAKKHAGIAQKYTEMADFNDAFANVETPQLPQLRIQPMQVNTNIPVPALVESVGRKSGRVKDLAERLKTDEDTIERLIRESGGQIYKAERGWLKARQI